MVNLSLRLLSILAVGVLSEPAPGRFPKVYNALITSNQNLEPSKAYPVYQPVLHQAFAFPFQDALFYNDFPASHGFIPQPQAAAPKEPQPQPSEATPTVVASENPTELTPSSTEAPAPPLPESSSPAPSEEAKVTVAPPPPEPNTPSPIPLNEFGLPPQVLPLGRFDGFGNPAYTGFSQIGPYPYSFPGLRLYDPFDAFSVNPFGHYPLYRPLTNVLGPNVPLIPNSEPSEPSSGDTAQSTEKSGQTPPSEPSDLNVLNYSSKDPAIPDVPPPPLPQGGLKSDKTE